MCNYTRSKITIEDTAYKWRRILITAYIQTLSQRRGQINPQERRRWRGGGGRSMKKWRTKTAGFRNRSRVNWMRNRPYIRALRNVCIECLICYAVRRPIGRSSDSRWRTTWTRIVHLAIEQKSNDARTLLLLPYPRKIRIFTSEAGG